MIGDRLWGGGVNHQSATPKFSKVELSEFNGANVNNVRLSWNGTFNIATVRITFIYTTAYGFSARQIDQ